MKIEELISDELAGSERWASWRIETHEDHGVGRNMLILVPLKRTGGKRVEVELPRIPSMTRVNPATEALWLADLREAIAKATGEVVREPAGDVMTTASLAAFIEEYREKRPTMKAMRFTETNEIDMLRFIGPGSYIVREPVTIEHPHETGRRVFWEPLRFETRINARSLDQACPVGSWVVLGFEFGRHAVLTDEQFRSKFEVA